MLCTWLAHHSMAGQGLCVKRVWMSEHAENQGTAKASKLQTVVPHPCLERLRLAGRPHDAGGHWRSARKGGSMLPIHMGYFSARMADSAGKISRSASQGV